MFTFILQHHRLKFDLKSNKNKTRFQQNTNLNFDIYILQAGFFF